MSLDRVARPFTWFVERFYPDPWVFLVLLTFLTFGLAFGLTETSISNALFSWGNGLSQLMAFIAQICLMVVVAHALAHTGPVRRGLSALSRLPKKEWQAYLLVALVACATALFSWSFCLVASAIVARQVAIEGGRKNLAISYPLLVATAYIGLSIWHMGYSASAPLFVATAGHILEDQIGVIPFTATVLTPWNIATALAAIAVICVICPLMHPKKGAIRIPESVLNQLAEQNEKRDTLNNTRPETIAKRLDAARWLNISFGLLLLGFLIIWFATQGIAIDLNIVIWTLLVPTLLLTRSPIHLMQLIRDAASIVGPVLLQYPFYAGVMGLMVGTGLVSVISGWFVEIATDQTLCFWALVSGGIVNLFVPSGGGQWVVQGPIFIEASEVLGVDPAKIVMAVAYGDQWTNLIQPFWTIPLLAIAGLHVRQILGYCFVGLIALFFVFGGSLLLIS
ncbi:MAG: TIGR00366 family protein [Gammaproteobacteria bacterium]